MPGTLIRTMLTRVPGAAVFSDCPIREILRYKVNSEYKGRAQVLYVYVLPWGQAYTCTHTQTPLSTLHYTYSAVHMYSTFFVHVKAALCCSVGRAANSVHTCRSRQLEGIVVRHLSRIRCMDSISSCPVKNTRISLRR